jgi:hypothetical protein
VYLIGQVPNGQSLFANGVQTFRDHETLICYIVSYFSAAIRFPKTAPLAFRNAHSGALKIFMPKPVVQAREETLLLSSGQ